MSSEGKNKIIFYIGQPELDFEKIFSKQLEELKRKNFKFHVFEQIDRPIPELCINGSCVAGRKDIQNELEIFLSKN